MKLFGKKKVLDEREQLEMYKNEHYAFWFLYVVLVVGLVVRTFFFDATLLEYAWEWFAFLAVSIWLVAADFCRGNYDYFTRPGWKSYLMYSVIFSVLFTAIQVAMGVYKGRIDSIQVGCMAGLTEFVFLFVLTYAALAVFGEATKRRRKKLEESYDDE